MKAPQQTPPAITIHGLTKSFGAKAVLKGVDLDVPRGSVFCLLGSNGAGKSTTIRILTTVLQPDGGRACVMGHDVVHDKHQVRRSVSLTGQSAAVDEMLTGRENVVMTARLFHIPQPQHRADALLERFGLADVAGVKVSTYSGGMRRRLDIAMGLSGRPDIVFLDEPTTGLDPQSRIEMWRIVEDLARDGTTIFLTTQYLEEAERLADRIAILHEGRIAAQGTPQELKARVAGEDRIVFYLATPNDLDRAAKLTEGWEHATDPEHLALTVNTDGSLQSAAAIIQDLDGVEVTSMETKRASLEEVFLDLVGASESRNTRGPQNQRTGVPRTEVPERREPEHQRAGEPRRRAE